MGEDLWLDLYKNIDEGYGTMEAKQYEYEMTGQGESSVSEVIGPILAEEGIECDINSTQEIEELLGNTGESEIRAILEKCSGGSETLPTQFVEEVQTTLNHIKNSYGERAQNKTDMTFKVSRIGLYYDGSTENSGFDLIDDILEINKIIFTQELKYEGVPYEKSADEALDDFIEEDKDYLYEESEDEDETSLDDEDGTVDDEDETLGEEEDEIPLWEHEYVCKMNDGSGLSEEEIDDILTGIEGSGSGGSTPRTSIWVFPSGGVSNGASWGWPFPGAGPIGDYQKTKDSWKCDDVLCIIIEIQKSTYWLAGWETMSIEKILSKAGEHLSKAANASLTQRKMTTNNFELGSIIKNLPDMLRWFGLEVSSAPVPILDLEDKSESEALKWDMYEPENLISTYYKNNGLEYNRANDLDIWNRNAEEEKVFQTSAGMPTTYPEERMNELRRFQAAMRGNNTLISDSLDSQLMSNDMKEFWNQFAELERFVAWLEDFCNSIGLMLGDMKKIPTRSS